MDRFSKKNVKSEKEEVVNTMPIPPPTAPIENGNELSFLSKSLKQLQFRMNLLERAFRPVRVSFYWKNPDFLACYGINSNGVKIPLLYLQDDISASIRTLKGDVFDKLSLTNDKGDLGFKIELDEDLSIREEDALPNYIQIHLYPCSTKSTSTSSTSNDNTGSPENPEIEIYPNDRISFPMIDKLSHRLSQYSGPEEDFLPPEPGISDSIRPFSHIIHSGPIAWGACTLHTNISKGMISELNITCNLSQRRYIRVGVCPPYAQLDMKMYESDNHWFWFGYSGLFSYPPEEGGSGDGSNNWSGFTSCSYNSDVQVILDRSEESFDTIYFAVGEEKPKSLSIKGKIPLLPDDVRFFVATFDPLDSFHIRSTHHEFKPLKH